VFSVPAHFNQVEALRLGAFGDGRAELAAGAESSAADNGPVAYRRRDVIAREHAVGGARGSASAIELDVGPNDSRCGDTRLGRGIADDLERAIDKQIGGIPNLTDARSRRNNRAERALDRG
jgi:hypothetical protein